MTEANEDGEGGRAAFRSPEDMLSFLSEAVQCLAAAVSQGKKIQSPEMLCYKHEQFMRAFINQFFALYEVHRGQSPEFFSLVKLQDVPAAAEAAVDLEDAYRGGLDPDGVIQKLEDTVSKMRKNIEKLNEESKHRSMWGGLRKPTHARFTVAGGNC